jgi:hypothetical protein
MRLASSFAAAVAVLMALSVGAAGGEPPGKPPTHFSWGYFCPDGYPVRAYGRYFYPPGHPDLPKVTVKPSRCYQDDGEAESAGLEPKPPPHGWRVFAGIYLAPSLGYLRTNCQQGVEAAGFAVPCPRFTPNPVFEFAGCQAVASCYTRGRFVMEGDFYGPPSYRGKPWVDCTQPGACRTHRNAGHAFIFAADAKHVKEIECCRGRPAGSAGKVHGQAAHWLSFRRGSGLNRKHVMLVWQQHGLTCAVSVYSDNLTNRRLARFLATWTTFVR